MIDYKGNFWYFWSIFILNVTCFSGFFYAHAAAFRDTIDDHSYILHTIEISFLLDMIFHFFLTYEENIAVKRIVVNFRKTSKNYFETNFKRDFILLIPFLHLNFGPTVEFFAAILKTYRLRQGIDQIDIPRLLKKIKMWFNQYILEEFESE